MIVEADVELGSIVGGSLYGSAWGVAGAIHGRSGTWLIEPSTWVRPGTRLAAAAALGAEPAELSPRWSGPRPPLAAGDRLAGYRLLERLGRGGQGDVWKAMRREPFTELVALKVLKPALARNPARMAQFRREAERGGRLAGPSLLRVDELGTFDGYHYMAMPYVEGITLREVVRARAAHLEDKPTDVIHRLVTLDATDYLRAMIRIMADAADALARVHAQRIAHRDIKPANILLDNRRPEGVYLCDFGLGRDLEVATPQQMRDGAGTPMYMAPERLLRATADEIKCDIYSLGVTTFEALTLDRPFEIPEHVTFASLSAFLAGARPRRPRELRRGFPEELEAVVLKAMDRDPANRYDSADQLAQDLRRVELHLAFRTARAPLDGHGPHPSLARGPHSAPVPGMAGRGPCRASLVG
jgi:eukaryotic-like serine/threonine-protein kinase